MWDSRGAESGRRQGQHESCDYLWRWHKRTRSLSLWLLLFLLGGTKANGATRASEAFGFDRNGQAILCSVLVFVGARTFKAQHHRRQRQTAVDLCAHGVSLMFLACLVIVGLLRRNVLTSAPHIPGCTALQLVVSLRIPSLQTASSDDRICGVFGGCLRSQRL